MKYSFEDEVQVKSEQDSARSRYMSIYDWVEAAVFSIICVVMVFTFLFRIVGVDGPSMMNTLLDKQRLILTSYPITPERGDIVVINRYTQEPIVKRVIATAGDKLFVDPEDYSVYLNGEKLQEDYTIGYTQPHDLTGEITIPKGYVFVMGDNRTVSLDSRYNEVGIVSVKDVMGKAVFRIWPFDSFGTLPNVTVGPAS